MKTLNLLNLVRSLCIVLLVSMTTACSDLALIELPEIPLPEVPQEETQESNPDTPIAESQPEFAIEIVSLVNQFRSKSQICGAEAFPATSALSLSLQLNQAAQRHSEDMAANNFFDHDDPNGTSPFDRINATGYVHREAGENIAAGNASAKETMQQWIVSAGHCRNMMDSNFTELGVGYAFDDESNFRHYWTQVFASPFN